MRCALFTLIKRQILDDKLYFVSALVIPGILALMFVCLGFMYPQELPLHLFSLLIALPALICVYCFTLGAAQIYNEQTRGTMPFLSVLPIEPQQIFLSRFVSGTFVIATITILLAIIVTGGIFTGILLWPDTLFPGGLVDLFVGTFTLGLGCYCLGLYIAEKARTFTQTFGAMPLVLVLSLLIVVKGFGKPLLVVVVLSTGVSLVCLLTPSTRRWITSIATGIMVVILIGIIIFWGRYFSDVALVANLPQDADHIEINDTGLLQDQTANVLNDRHIPDVFGGFREFSFPTRRRNFDIHYMFAPLGIIEYLQSKEPGEKRISLKNFGDYRGVYFDEGKGLVIHERSGYKIYIGPEGVLETPDNCLGRFVSPIISSIYYGPILYDRKSNRFFAIDVKHRCISKGPELNNPEYHPFDIIEYSFNPEDCRVGGAVTHGNVAYPGGYIAVLDESGRIDLLNRETLELVRAAGCLPHPKTLFGRGSCKPKDLLAYDIELFGTRPGREYAGMIAGSLSRQGTSMAVAVYDKEGKQIKTGYTKTLSHEDNSRSSQAIPSAKATFFETPWGPFLTITKYVFESLHPPVLTLASYFTAYSFEARSTHRALFLMPNSFVAMARDFEGNLFWTILLVLTLMLPALLFSIVLGLRVVRDAVILGLSPNSKRLWFLSTMAFGLPAYITYRLTRPKITLVTCTNCGKLRRLDMDTCHWCNSPWHVPELTPPAWRILDSHAEEVGEDLEID